MCVVGLSVRPVRRVRFSGTGWGIKDWLRGMRLTFLEVWTWVSLEEGVRFGGRVIQ